jgi:hypothetical protein
MSKGAVILSAVPHLSGGTLGQLVEHDQDKNIIIVYTSGGSVFSSVGAGISHTHGSGPSITGPISVTSQSNAWSISIPDFLTTAALSNHTHGSINTVSIAGSVLTNSSASSGLSFGVPAWITTAPSLTHTHDYAGTGTSATGALITVNSNGVAINVTNTAAGDGFNLLAAGTQTAGTATTVLFSNSNNMSFGMSGGSRITASFSESTHAHPYINTSVSNNFLTTARASNDAIGLNTAQTNVTWTADSRGISINAGGYAGTQVSVTNVGLTVNSLGISASVDTAGLTAAGDGVNIIAAGSVTAGTVQTILFDDSNGISFGMDTDSTAITASHNAYSATSMFSASFLNTAEPHIRQLIAGASSYTSGTVHFVGTNNVTVTYDASSILFSGANTHAEQTGISGIAGSGASTVTNGTIQFANSNNVSFGLNGSTMTASIPAVSAISGISVSDALFTSGTVSFSNANSISFGSSGAGVISASVSFPAQTVQPVAISDSAGSALFSTLTVGTENGMTLYRSNGSLVGSYTVPTQSSEARVISLQGTSGALSLSGASNITVSALNGSTITIYGPSNILNSFSLGGNIGTTNSSNITGGGFLLAGGSNITLSQSNDSISIHGVPSGIRLGNSETTYTNGTVMLSGEANMTIGSTEVAGVQYFKFSAGGGTGTAGADGYNWLVAGTQTANTTGYVSLADSNGISFGMSNNSVITASYTVPNLTATSSLFFADGNGVTFGSSTAGSSTTITGSVSSFNGLDSVGFTTATNTGSAITGTLNSDGLYLSMPNYLTTAMQSAASSLFVHTGFTSSSVSGSLIDAINNTDGLSMAIPVFLTTAMPYQSSTRFIGLNTAQSNVIWTVNSAGISLNAGGYAGTGFTTATRTGSLISGYHNTGGLYLSIPNYLTTAMATGASVSFARTGFTTGSTGGSNIVGTLTTNGLSIRVPSFLTTVPSNSIVFVNSLNTNITFSSSTAGSTTSIYASAGGGTGGGGGIALRGSGTSIQSTGTVQFINTNGMSFELTNGSMRGSVINGNVYYSDGSYHTWSSSTAGNSTTMSLSINNGIVGIGNTATVPFTSGSVRISGVNLTVNTSSSGVSQYLQISAPAVGYLYFSNTNGHSWGSSVSGVSTSVYIIT